MNAELTRSRGITTWISGLDGAVILAVVIGWLYFIGALHASAYYRELGLAGYSPAYDFHAVVTTGASSLLSGSLIWSVWLVFSAEILLLILIVGALVRSLRRVRLTFASVRRRRAKIRRSATRLTAATRVELAVGWFEEISKPFAYLFLLLGIGIASVLLAQWRGSDVANSTRRGFIEAGKGARIVYLVNGADLRLGPRVGCDQMACAYLASDGVVVIARDRIVSEALVVASEHRHD